MTPIPEPPRQWAYFAQGDKFKAETIAGCAATLYLFERSKQVRGTPLITFNPAPAVQRILSSSPLNLGGVPDAEILSGGTQHLHYTTQEQRAKLVAVSAKEFPPSERTVAVLIPITKRREWWNLAHDHRGAFFARTPVKEGHTAIGEVFAGKIYRQLLHARYLESSAKRYDFLTYFEFDQDDTPVFQDLLSKLRDEDLNPEWKYVEHEAEHWMRKVATRIV